MKSFILLAITAAAFAFAACAHEKGPVPAPINPPGSGGRGDSPGMHAQSQAPR